MRIAGLQKVSLLDYPERLAATVFLAGCNLDCGYCHNRWMIREAAAPEALAVPELLAWLRSRAGLLDGVCLSGGEPTLSAELPALAREIKALGFLLKLDTNGTRPEALCALLEERLLDYVALDLKAPLDERYHAVVGVRVNLDDITASLALLRALAPAYELRTTAGPRLSLADLEAIAWMVQPGEAWFLQPFLAAEGVLERGPALAAAEIEAALSGLQTIAPGARLRGV